MTAISPLTRTTALLLLTVLFAHRAPGQTVISAKTGEFDATFDQRSPLSAPKELARRLRIQDKEVATDYDLSKFPFKVYVPKNYDAATPHGLFIYLGYKDSGGTPQPWWSALDEAHMIFVTPVAHSGAQYPKAIPAWQSVGLALDAVHNLKQQYTVQADRVYLMAWQGGYSIALGTADVFNGFVLIDVPEYYKKVNKDAHTFWPAKIPPPSAQMQGLIVGRGLFFGGIKDEFTDLMTKKVMPQDGYRHVTLRTLSLDSDLHYPDLAPDWFQKQALPFLDAAVLAEAKHPPAATVATGPASAPASSPPAKASAPATLPALSKADRLFNMAQLYANNGQRDLAKTKLRQLLADYPNDPAAGKAKQMLDQLASP